MDTKREKTQKLYDTFCDDFKSVMIASSDTEGQPNASYAPFYMDENRSIYVYISAMSLHTRNLMAHDKCSVMFIEDEKESKQIFARNRLTYRCKALQLEFDSDEWNRVSKKMSERFGPIIDNFRDMADFHIFKFTPLDGRFVIGFGAAYDIIGNDLNTLVHVKGNGHGHQSRKGIEKKLTKDDCQRIIEHMNDHHGDALMLFAKAFTDYAELLEGIDTVNMLTFNEKEFKLAWYSKNRGTTPTVPLIRTVQSASEAQAVLIEMTKLAREKLEL